MRDDKSVFSFPQLNSLTFRRCSEVVAFGKGNNNKKPKADLFSGESSSDDATVKARRITTSPGSISVKSQIKFIARIKEAEKESSSGPKIGRKFRRSKDIAVHAQRLRKDGRGNPDRTIWQPMATSDGSFLLMLDAYNVIGASEEYSRIKNTESIGAARTSLIDDVLQMASMRGWRVEVVFDAYMTSNPGSREAIAPSSKSSSRSHDVSLVSIVYTGRRDSADSYLEKKSFELSGGLVQAGSSWSSLVPEVPGSASSFGGVIGPQYYAVGTNDRAIINAVGSHGGMVMSSERVLAEIEQSKGEASYVASSMAYDTSQRQRKRERDSAIIENDEFVNECPSDEHQDKPLSKLEKLALERNKQRNKMQQENETKDRRKPDKPTIMRAALPFNAPPITPKFTNEITFPKGYVERLNKNLVEQQEANAGKQPRAEETTVKIKKKLPVVASNVAPKQKKNSKYSGLQPFVLKEIGPDVDGVSLLTKEAETRRWSKPRFTDEIRGNGCDCTVFVGMLMASASGGTKEDARQAAARAALDSIYTHHPVEHTNTLSTRPATPVVSGSSSRPSTIPSTLRGASHGCSKGGTSSKVSPLSSTCSLTPVAPPSPDPTTRLPMSCAGGHGGFGGVAAVADDAHSRISPRLVGRVELETPISVINEYCQKQKLTTSYTDDSPQGRGYDRVFSTTCSIINQSGEVLATSPGKGRKKKEAQQAAVHNAYRQLVNGGHA